MSTAHDPNEERTEETKQARVTVEETLSSIRSNDTADTDSRRKQVVIVAAGALFAIAIVLFAFFWLRPPKQVTTEAPAAPANTETVKFLMEQQWLIRMKLALIEEQMVAHQITATGRVVPAANSQALVAPPISGTAMWLHRSWKNREPTMFSFASTIRPASQSKRLVTH